MKNKLTDLNDHLFAQLERISDEDLAGDTLKQEINRTKAVASVAKQIISNGQLVLNAQKALSENVIASMPPMLGLDDK